MGFPQIFFLSKAVLKSSVRGEGSIDIFYLLKQSFFGTASVCECRDTRPKQLVGWVGGPKSKYGNSWTPQLESDANAQDMKELAGSVL